MAKPVNVSYSNTLISARQPHVNQKGENNINSMPPSSNANMAGFSRPNVNVGRIGINQGSKSSSELYDINLNFRGPFGKAYPMKHWRRQLSVNGRTGKSAALVSLSERPGGTVFRGYKPEFATTCECDPNAENLYVTFDNKFLQSTSKTIKPPAQISNIPDTNNNKVQNNGFIQIGPEGGADSYQIQTGVYETSTLCSSTAKNAKNRTRAITKMSKSYFGSTKEYLKARCNTHDQKQSINRISGNTYTSDLIGENSTQFKTNNCTNPNQTGRNCTNVTYYNPNNSQFGIQGAVDSGTRLLKLNVDTITKNNNSFRSAGGNAAANAGKYHGTSNSRYFIKSKYTRPLSWRRNGDKTSCSANGRNNCGPSNTLSSFWSSIN